VVTQSPSRMHEEKKTLARLPYCATLFQCQISVKIGVKVPSFRKSQRCTLPQNRCEKEN
jgi:hypothetical protein